MGVDLAQITFLGLTVQTWITVVIAAFGLMVSLLTFARGWRWRAEAAPLFAMLEGDKLLRPDFSKAGIDPPIVGYLVNCGDGRAFNVKAIGVNCDAGLWDCRQIGETVLGKQSEWVMNDCGRLPELTGETMRFFITIAPPQNPRPDQSSDLTKLELGVHWVSSPTHLQRFRIIRTTKKEIDAHIEEISNAGQVAQGERSRAAHFVGKGLLMHTESGSKVALRNSVLPE